MRSILKRAQVSLEMLIFIGIIMIFLIPLIGGLYIMSKSSLEEQTIHQTRVMARLLADKMYEIDSLPESPSEPGSMNVVLLLPEGIKKIEITYLDPAARTRTLLISFLVDTANGEKKISTTTFARLEDGHNTQIIDNLEPGRKMFNIKKSGKGVSVTLAS